MSSAKPTRKQADLADVLELILDKGIVINADIVITVGDTEMIGIKVRAAIASFETAAEYGLAFPSGTDMKRVEQASGRDPLSDEEAVDLDIEASTTEESDETRDPPGERPDPSAAFDDDDITEAGDAVDLGDVGKDVENAGEDIEDSAAEMADDVEDTAEDLTEEATDEVESEGDTAEDKSEES